MWELDVSSIDHLTRDRRGIHITPERGQPHHNVGDDRLEMLFEHVFNAEAIRRGMEKGDPERRGAAPQRLEQGEIVQRCPGLSPTASRCEPECTECCRTGDWRPHQEIEDTT